MKQADIEATARNWFQAQSSFPGFRCSRVARELAYGLTQRGDQLLAHVRDNPHWWYETAYMPEVSHGSYCYPTCLRDVVYEIILDIVVNALTGEAGRNR